MRIILYSDLQLHPWKEFSQSVDGVNDRLFDHIHVLEQILEYAIENKIKYIFFGGDMFEARAKVDVVAAKLLAEWKWNVSKAGIFQVDVIGNHDLVDKSTYHNAIELYKRVPNQTIITEPCWYPISPNYALLLAPYQHSLEAMKAAMQIPLNNSGLIPTIAIVHYGLYDVPTETQGVIRDLGYDTEGQMRLADLEPALSTVKRMFFGHFHVTTEVNDKVHFIGTPLQHKWGEKNVKTRFLDINLEDGSYKSVSTEAPRFLDFDTTEQVKDVQGNFVRLKIADMEQKDTVIESLLQAGARGATVVPVPKKFESNTRLGLNLSMTFEEMGSRMVDNDYETKLNHERLKSTLYDLLKEAAVKRAG